MDFSFSESQNLLRESVRDLMSRYSPEYWRGKDERKEFPGEFEKSAAELGLFVEDGEDDVDQGGRRRRDSAALR